jgi:hypothetical protein
MTTTLAVSGFAFAVDEVPVAVVHTVEKTTFEIPLPAPVLLLLSAIGGIGALGRMRNKEK